VCDGIADCGACTGGHPARGGLRDLFENQCQFRHFQSYLTRLIVLPNKSMVNIARCILQSADKTNLSRFLSEAPWREEAIKGRRVRFRLPQTTPHLRCRRDSLVAIDDTLCEQVGSLFAYVDRHYNHSDRTYPLARNPVTSLYVSGPVRFPVGLRRYRRYEELTQWGAAVAKPVPDLPIPRAEKACNRPHKQIAQVLLKDPEFRARHEQFRANIALVIDLVEEAIQRKGPLGVVVFDAWYLAEEWVQVFVRRRKDWISLLETNRLLETARFQLRDGNGWAMKLPSPHIAVEDLVSLIPALAYRVVKVGEPTYWCFTLAVCIPGLGQVRIGVSFEHESSTGHHVVLVTNRVDWSATQSIGLYLQRWPIESSRPHYGSRESLSFAAA
jgi:DDE superfamily endonuclease